MPRSAAVTLAIVSVAPVAPATGAPLRSHWYVGAGVPEAVTENSARWPRAAITLAGGVATAGAVRTVSVAGVLTAAVVALRTVTV